MSEPFLQKMKRVVLILLACLLVTASAWAQTPAESTGTISTAGADCSTATRCVTLAIGEATGTGLITVGTFTGTIAVEISPDNASWTSPAGGTTSITTTGNYFTSLQGARFFRVRASTLSSGTPAIVLSATSAPFYGSVAVSSSALPTGAATDTTLTGVKTGTDKIPALGQAVAGSSVPVVLPAAQITTLTPPAALTNFATETGGNLAAIKTDADKIPSQGQALAAASLPVVLPATQITTLTPLSTVTANLGTLNGAATAAKQPALGTAGSASTDVITVQGIASGVAQPISAASLPLPSTAATSTKQSDGSQKTQIVDGSGNVIASTSNNLNVQCANCSGSGASAVDNATVTESTSTFAPIGGEFQTTPGTVTTGHQAIAAITAKRGLQVSLFDASGNALLGQQLAAASIPVILPAATITTLTPPAAISGFALEAGHLAAIDTATARLPAQGQALAAASLPVVLTAIQQTALTPPAAITGFALEAGHLASLDTKAPALGQALAAASVPVILPAATITTLTPPTTITANAGTNLNTSALALDATLSGVIRAEDTASADADKGIGALAIRKATPANTSNADGDYEYLQMNAGRLWASATIDSALPAGTNVIGHTITDSGSTTAVTGTVAENLTQVGGASVSLGKALAVNSIPVVHAMDDPVVNALQQLGLALRSSGKGGFLGSFGRPVTSTGDALDVNVKYPAAIADACAGRKFNVAISQTANALLVSGVGGKLVAICALTLVGADAENISFVEGTGATCGTNTAAIIGGTTAATGPNMGANGGFALGSGAGTVAIAAKPGTDLCLFQSGAGRVAGNLTYAVQQP